MKKITFKKLAILVMCFVLVAVMGCTLVSCDIGNGKKEDVPDIDDVMSNNSTESGDNKNDAIQEIGLGDKTFFFIAVGKDGHASYFKVKTNKKTVGDALHEWNMIEGEEGPYGMYVNKVLGMEVNASDNEYWAFYINDEYAMTGVEKTEIKEGEQYCLRVETFQ